MKTLVTHNGKFHADDIFACAVLQLHLDKQSETYQVIRTRDPQIIASGDYVFDVGGEYNAPLNRFDHHQIGRAGERPNGVPYSSIGLVWKQFGEYITGSKQIADHIDEKIIQSLDALDNGVDLYKKNPGMPEPFLIHGFLYSYFPTWKESSDYDIDAAFAYLVEIVKKGILRMIIQARDFYEAKDSIAALYASTENNKILILDQHYPWEEILVAYELPLLVILPKHDGNWKAETTFSGNGLFERRMYFPKKWAGLRDEELQAATGVSDAVFCHNGRFMCVAKSKEGALALAQKALEA